MKQGKYLRFILLSLSLIITICIFGCNNLKEKTKMSNLKIHYHRYDGKYEDWTLWTWTESFEKEIQPADTDNYGLIYKLDLAEYPKNEDINFLPKYKEWQAKDAPHRLWKRDQESEIWILPNDPNIYTSQPDTSKTVQKAFIDQVDSLTVTLSHPLTNQEIDELEAKIIFENGKDLGILRAELFPSNAQKSNIIVIKTEKNIELSSLPAKLKIEDWQEGPVLLRHVFDDPEYQTESPLGADYTPKRTIFRV